MPRDHIDEKTAEIIDTLNGMTIADAERALDGARQLIREYTRIKVERLTITVPATAGDDAHHAA